MKFRDLILHDFRLKLFSLLIAVLVWEAIHLSILRESGGQPAGGPTQTELPPH